MLVKGAFEDVQETVVIPLRDRVVLVRMAAGALECQAEHRGAKHLDFVGNDFEPVRNKVGEVVPGRVRRHAEETSGDHVIVYSRRDLGCVLVIRQFVAGELLKQKAIIGLIGVEGTNDVIAIAPSVGPQNVLLTLALRIRIACQVEPVPAPALAVSRGREQAVDHFLISIWIAVGEEGRHLCWLGRQSG